MTTLRVDLGELAETELQLRRVSSDLSALDDGKRVDGSAFGSFLVRDAFAEYRQHWSDGLHRISETTTNTADSLRSIRSAYDSAEQCIVSAATPGSTA
ncbi:hypothetical protein AB0L40_22275 [Patulibacter sp. NPDC049589]|uniref:hypothetical protein n=1 Tax=Patulibacter sp. NPDC049589 TaxID=3154731 RepID=UPI00341E2E87